jgi:hypothetical protein
MKRKTLILTFIMLLGCCSILSASQADEFRFDKKQLQSEFADLNQLEQLVQSNNFMTLSEMRQNHIITGNLSEMNLTNSLMMDPALGIPGFWWGCILGLIGVLCVFLITDGDKAEVKQAFIGCLISSLLGITVQVVINL